MTPAWLKPKNMQSHSRESGYGLKPSVFRRLIQIENFLSAILGLKMIRKEADTDKCHKYCGFKWWAVPGSNRGPTD